MVFYFSATGNSLWVARQLADAFGMSLHSVVSRKEEGSRLSVFSDKEPLFLVFPVHSWGPAVPMFDFIDGFVTDDYTGQPIYIVCVCGDDCGRTDKIVDKMLHRKGLRLTSAFSVQMPNNYILLPGFDVDAPSVAEEKLNAASVRVQAIVEAVRRGGAHRLYGSGKLPGLKSLVYPLFRKYVCSGNSFRVTDACTACGKCIRICPTKTISGDREGRPRWKKKGCVQCLACIHRCPVRAIEYGRISEKKGRYHHPDCP